MKNRALQRAILSLAHPLSIAAIVLLLLNDHIFKYQWPSWWTGKLSDFAGLLFAPLLLAVPLAFIFSNPRHERLVFRIAFLAVGLTFSLIKTIPIFNIVAIHVLEAGLGGHIAITLDLTDLIALPVLIVGWQLAMKQNHDLSNLRRMWGWGALVVGAMASIATSQGPVGRGIECVARDNDKLFAGAYVSGRNLKLFASTDGGLSWQPTEPQSTHLNNCVWYLNGFVLKQDALVQYEFGLSTISRSENNGQTWTEEINWHDLTREVYRLYNEALTKLGDVYTFTPQMALIDPQTENVVVAMGHNGVLVRTSDGTWHWVAVGKYNLYNHDQAEIAQFVVEYNLWPILILIPLSIATMANYLSRIPGNTNILACTWVGWAIFVMWFTVGSSWVLFDLLVFLCIVPALSLFSSAIYEVAKESSRAFAFVLLAALLGSGLFLLPFILWAYNIIPQRGQAAFFAISVAGLMPLIGHYYLKKVVRIKSKKKKNA